MGQSSVIELGEAPERIAVIKMSALGDVAKSVPTVRAIRQAYPTCSLAWIVRPAWADLLIGNPDIDRLIVVRRSLRGLVDAMREVRRFGPDLVLDMQGLLTSGLLAFASGARHRYTWVSGRELSGLLTGNPVVPGPTSLNVAECNFGFARLLGITDMPVAPPTYLTDGNPSRGQAQLMLNEAPRPIVGIHLGGSEPNKRWPAARWAEVVSGLRRMGVGVALLGGPGDRQIAEDVAARTNGGALVLAGRTSLRELAAVAGECAVFIGGDSGATHVAALVGTRTVCLMGATLPQHSGPFGPGHRILYLGLECSPCYRRPTCAGRYDCMVGITPAAVLDACRASLAEQGIADISDSARTS